MISMTPSKGSNWLRVAFAAFAAFAACAAGAISVSLTPAHAQSCIESWGARFGTPLDDQIHAALRDNSGNVYLGGFEGGRLGVENYWPVGDAKGFVEKRSSNGTRLWRHEFDTPGTDIVEALALDANGRLGVAGRTDGSFPGTENGGQFDLFVALLDTDGTLVSLRQEGNERPQHPVAMTFANGGDLIVVGYDDEYVLGNAVIDRQNGFLARFHIDAGGSIDMLSWTASSSPQADEVTGIANAPNGSGDVFISTVVAAGPASGGGVHVLRVDPQNNVLWTQTPSTNSLDYITSVGVARSGRLYAAGAAIDNVGGESNGNSDGFVLELDPDTGEQVNAVKLGSIGPDGIYSLAIDASGALFVGGIATDTVVAGFHGDGSLVPFEVTLSQDLKVIGGWQPDPPAVLFVDGMVVVPAECSGKALVAGSAALSTAGPSAPVRVDSIVIAIETAKDAIFAGDFDENLLPANELLHR